MTLGTRDDLLACRPRTEDVKLNGKTYRVRGLSYAGRERLNAENFVLDKRGTFQIREGNRAGALLLQECLIDAEGKPLFSPDDLDAIGQIPPAVADPLIAAAQRLSGLGDENRQDLGKGSGATPAA